MELKNKKILVTGGAGFIGSHTVDALIKEGADVVVVDNLSTGKKENINPDAKFYCLNIADPKIEKILEEEKPEFIYHLAFYVLVPKSTENPLLDMDCLIGSLRIFQKAKDIGVKKIIFASSGFVYGNTKNLPVKETEPTSCVSPYAISKCSIENYLRFFNNTYNIPYVILRYSAVYGPRQITGAMASYIRSLSQGKQDIIWGKGKTRDYIFIEDVVRANILALDLTEKYIDPVFNIGMGEETSLETVYKKIADLLGVEAKPICYPDRPGEQIRYCLDNSKAKKDLGWKPNVSLDEGLKKTIEFFNKNVSK